MRDLVIIYTMQTTHDHSIYELCVTYTYESSHMYEGVKSHMRVCMIDLLIVCVAVCCSVLQRVAACCSVLQRVSCMIDLQIIYMMQTTAKVRITPCLNYEVATINRLLKIRCLFCGIWSLL